MPGVHVPGVAPLSNTAYLASHRVRETITTALGRVLDERPVDPVTALGEALLEASKTTDAAYAAAVKYIFSNADFSGSAKRYQKPQENWQRFETLLDHLGQPYRKLKVVHIAGTNGKGTTSALCDAMLRASVPPTASVGLFTSPHLHSFRERIRVDGRLVDKTSVVDALNVVQPAVEQLGYASPFEKLTALALVIFTHAGCEWAVMETGLGGRWDCTNHCAPLVCGITRVGLDHMNVLGSTIGAIANEKAGIIKASTPVFAVPQHEDALPVITNAATQQGAPLVVVESPIADGATLPFWLSPRHQQHNAAMARAMLGSLYERGHLAGGGAPMRSRAAAEAAWTLAIDALVWPCRFEVFGGLEGASPTVSLMVDVAHNEPAIEALLASVTAAWPDTPCALIFGANFDKDVQSIVAKIRGLPNLVLGVAVQSSHPKAVPTKQILDAVTTAAATGTGTGTGTGAGTTGTGAGTGAGTGGASAAPWLEAASMGDALARAIVAVDAPTRGGLVVCCGSVFVAADMREVLAEKQPSLFAHGDWVFDAAAEPALLM